MSYTARSSLRSLRYASQKVRTDKRNSTLNILINPVQDCHQDLRIFHVLQQVTPTFLDIYTSVNNVWHGLLIK